MIDEGIRTSESRKIVDSCRQRLGDRDYPQDRQDELCEMLRKSLEEDNLLDTIKDAVDREARVFHKKLSSAEYAKLVRGQLFESIALESLPREDRKFPELELFLLWSLKDPSIWYMNWGGDLQNLTSEEQNMVRNYYGTRPTPEELRALQNNDAISINIETDPSTNKVVAVITGVVEAKNHRLREGGGDENQMHNSPYVLYNTVARYRDVFPIILRGLDLGPGMPDEIDIVDPDKLSYTIILPSNLDTEEERSRIPVSFKDCKLKYAPVSWEDTAILAKSIIDAMPVNSR